SVWGGVVARRHNRPENCPLECASMLHRWCRKRVFGQALDRLVPASSVHYCTYTPGLSTSSSTRGLTLRRQASEGGRSNLEDGFTLRCLQRLSVPHMAVQPCPGRDNW